MKDNEAIDSAGALAQCWHALWPGGAIERTRHCNRSQADGVGAWTCMVNGSAPRLFYLCPVQEWTKSICTVYQDKVGSAQTVVR
jgi:hypothetical protein